MRSWSKEIYGKERYEKCHVGHYEPEVNAKDRKIKLVLIHIVLAIVTMPFIQLIKIIPSVIMRN